MAIALGVVPGSFSLLMSFCLQNIFCIMLIGISDSCCIRSLAELIGLMRLARIASFGVYSREYFADPFVWVALSGNGVVEGALLGCF